MFTKILHKAMHPTVPQPKKNGGLTASDLDVRMVQHYGIPHTASIMAFDPVQRLLAIGTLDGRIKIIGGHNIEVFLVSQKQLPYKFLEFLCNQGVLISISNDNDIQTWDLKNQRQAHAFQWESNITAFSVIYGTCLMYIGDDEGSISVLKYDDVESKIVKLPYYLSAKALTDAACISFPCRQSVVGILPQPFTSGNRVLIAYGCGVIILWDISNDQVITVKGHVSLQLKGEEPVDSPMTVQNEQQDHLSEIDQEKEICSLCWACKSGSILAVGYIDGDILLWNISSKTKKGMTPSGDVVRLQLSSGVRRIPVIVLHWSPDTKSTNDCSGFLFIYGGVDIGSEEVLTVLHLDWPSGAGSVNCVARVDLTLSGSFADMVLIPENDIAECSSTLAAFVLTNPGQLHVYDGSKISNSNLERSTAKPDNFPLVIPTLDPCMTISKMFSVLNNKIALSALLERASTHGATLPILSGGTKWPLIGGIPGSFAKDAGIEKVHIAGYEDGSIRIWDATFPVLTLLSVIEGDAIHLKDIKLVPGISSISALDFCSASFALAAGTDSGLVHIYKIKESTEESEIRFLTNNNLEVHTLHQKGTIHHTAIVSLASSPVQALDFVHFGARLAIGFRCNRVLLMDIETLSVLFAVDYLIGSNMGIVSVLNEVIPFSSLTWKHSSPRETMNMDEEVLFILTKDAHIVIADSNTGSMISTKPVCPKKGSIAVSMHIVGRTISQVKRDAIPNNITVGESANSNQSTEEKPEVNLPVAKGSSNFKELMEDVHLLLCCEDALRLYSLQSVIEGEKKCLKKVKLDKTCCWSATFMGQTEKSFGAILLYQTGDLEIRSLPSLEVMERSSLMLLLRWGFKKNMTKNMSSSGDGQVSLVNGCEMAFISILACENGFSLPKNPPSLHDEVLAAAAHAAIGISFVHKKNQDATTSGFFGSLIKGLRGTREGANEVSSWGTTNFVKQLEGHFCRIPFSTSSTTMDNEDNELSIDDIEIDDPLPPVSSSSQTKNDKKEVNKEREKLFDNATTSSKPRLRTPEEILTKYKFGGDATAAAAHARDKLVQRQEKLQRAQERAEELRNHAEDFESLAKELAKAMEKKKFWKF